MTVCRARSNDWSSLWRRDFSLLHSDNVFVFRLSVDTTLFNQVIMIKNTSLKFNNYFKACSDVFIDWYDWCTILRIIYNWNSTHLMQILKMKRIKYSVSKFMDERCFLPFKTFTFLFWEQLNGINFFEQRWCHMTLTMTS